MEGVPTVSDSALGGSARAGGSTGSTGATAEAARRLGLDPLAVGNEGCFVAAVPADQCDAALAVLRAVDVSAAAVRFGTAVAEHPGVVLARTAIGGSRAQRVGFVGVWWRRSDSN